MPSNVPPHLDPLSVVGLDALDEAALTVRRELKGLDTTSTTVFHQAITIRVRGVHVALAVTLRGPNSKTYAYALDGPRADGTVPADGPTPEQMLAAHVAVAREAYRKVSAADVGNASWNQLLAQRAELRGTLAALLDAVERYRR